MATEQDFSAAARQAGREMRQLRSNMPSFVELAVFLVLFASSIGLAIYLGQTSVGWGIFVGLAGATPAQNAASVKDMSMRRATTVGQNRVDCWQYRQSKGARNRRRVR